MQDICSNPKPTHSDMALIPAQGRDPEDVKQDIAQARAAAEAIRNERVAAWGLTPTARSRFPEFGGVQKREKGVQATRLDALLVFMTLQGDWAGIVPAQPFQQVARGNSWQSAKINAFKCILPDGGWQRMASTSRSPGPATGREESCRGRTATADETAEPPQPRNLPVPAAFPLRVFDAAVVANRRPTVLGHDVRVAGRDQLAHDDVLHVGRAAGVDDVGVAGC